MTKSLNKYFVLILLLFAFASASYYSNLGRTSLSANEFTKESSEVAPLKLIPVPDTVSYSGDIDFIKISLEISQNFKFEEIQFPQNHSVIIYLSSDSSPPALV